MSDGIDMLKKQCDEQRRILDQIVEADDRLGHFANIPVPAPDEASPLALLKDAAGAIHRAAEAAKGGAA